MAAHQLAQFTARPKGARYAVDLLRDGEWIRVAYRGDIEGARRSVEAFGPERARIALLDATVATGGTKH